MLMRYVIIVFMAFAGLAQARATDEMLKLEVPVSPDLTRYVFLLQAPSYAALALQNAGSNISLSKPLVIVDRATFEVGPGRVKHVDKKAGMYRYTVTLTLPLGKQVSFPVEVDSAEIAHGRLLIRLQPPLAGLIPRELMEKAESKLQALGNANAQKQLAAYLAKLDAREASEVRQANILDRIAFDAYAQAGLGTAKDAGIGEPVSDQLALITSILIWAVCFPAFLFVVRRHRARCAHAAENSESRMT